MSILKYAFYTIKILDTARDIYKIGCFIHKHAMAYKYLNDTERARVSRLKVLMHNELAIHGRKTSRYHHLEYMLHKIISKKVHYAYKKRHHHRYHRHYKHIRHYSKKYNNKHIAMRYAVKYQLI